MSVQEEEELKRQITNYLRLNQIRPSQSPFASPILFVKKKNGTFRMCVDYRILTSKYTIRDQYPLPRINELTDNLQGAHYFTKLDLMSGYHQIRVYEKDIYKTAFRCKFGHYEFNVMPFGLCNAPAAFQKLMNELLKPFLFQTVVVYLDDILIFSRTQEEYYEHIEQVFKVIQEAELKLNLKKREFNRNRVDYLGFVIKEGTVRPQDTHIESINKWKAPLKNKKEVRSFLGIASYYRKFIPNFAGIAKPLTDLLVGDNHNVS